MTPERWSRLTDLFEAALDREPAERAAFLASACADDDAMQREVSLLIDSHERAGDFGSTPVFHIRTASASHHADASAHELDRGVRLGRYEIIALVGSGGMGRVYQARDPQLGRDVGVKVLPHGAGISGDQLARFGREARALAALNHPNILTVYDVGLDREIPYVVSELLDGETLRARLQRGKLPLEDTVALARQIASGLAAAHDKGIIHRDLKPENLFVGRDGVVKILDFGLAKHAMDAGNGRDLLDRGYVMGTAGYMSPEQVHGREADARSDLFSFGAVLHEMLTGRRAFSGHSPVDIMRAVCDASPAGADEVPAAFRALLNRCLAKDPAERIDSAHSVIAAFRQLAAPSDAAPPTARRYMPYVAAMILGVIAIAIILIGQRRDAPPTPGAAGRQALAIMPFDDRSGDPANAWLSSGVPSMLVTSLAQTPGLDVIGTDRLEASFRELGLAPMDRSARHKVAQRAGAGAVLIGTIFKVGSDTRLDVQVHDVATGRIVVARAASGSDLFGLVDGIAQDVRAALDVAGRSNMRPLRDVTTASLAAYEMYAKAQRARHNNRWGDARTLFEEAVRIDPAFTLARAQLVEILERLGEETAAEAGRQIVKTQIHRLPERQRLLAEALDAHDANPALAVELLERLLERYPDEEEAYDLIVHAYTHTRDPEYHKKTLAFMERWARAIPGPGSGHFHNHYGYAYIEHGLFTEAEREFRAYIRVSPDEANGYDSLAELFLLTGRPAMAVEYYDKALRLNPLFGWSHYGRAYALAAQGQYDEAFASLRTLQSLGSRSAVPAAAIHALDALLCSRAGLYAKATDHVEAARRLARELGDAGAEADVDLVDAAFAVERGQHARAVNVANRFAAAGFRPPSDIMSVRRTALAHLMAGLAELRQGRLDDARRRLATLRTFNTGSDPIQVSWQHALTGEIALAEHRFDEAESAFRASEYHIASSFAIYPTLVALANNLPFRDGLARTAAARGDLRRAVDLYRQLNEPDVTSKWYSLFDPRYARAAEALAARALHAQAPRRITFDDIARPKPGEWPSYNGRLSANRHSPLDQINTRNVARLVPRWTHEMGGKRALQMTPLVIDGMMYVAAVNEVRALNAKTGAQIWQFVRPQTPGLVPTGDPAAGINRAIAVLGNRVFLQTDHAHLLALDRQNGQVLWDVEMADHRQNYGATGALLVVNDLVIAGISAGDEGVRGFLDAYRASTGERVWRFWTVPARGEPGSETWIGKALEHGCATTWLTGSYDPDEKILYWPTGNPCPDYNGEERKGDNLYSSSVVALDPATGKLRWHFQFTPHDLHDWDANQPPMLVDAEFRPSTNARGVPSNVEGRGRRQKLLVLASRNGFFYVLDRLTGRMLMAEPFVKNITWASGIGADGRPQLLPGYENSVEGTQTCPAVSGAANWPASAYSPATGLFYVMAAEGCAIYRKNADWFELGKSFYGGTTKSVPIEGGGKYLRALDLQTGKLVWEIPKIGGSVTGSGLMSTAGGLVFYGDNTGGAFIAVDAKNGQRLWHFDTNEVWKSSPMTYAIDGKQYVSAVAGSTVRVFGLPE